MESKFERELKKTFHFVSVFHFSPENLLFLSLSPDCEKCVATFSTSFRIIFEIEVDSKTSKREKTLSCCATNVQTSKNYL